MSQSKSCVLLCNFNGIIQEVLNDDFGFEEIKNKPLTSIINDDFHSSSLDMLAEAKKNNIALDYKLSIQLSNTEIYLNFTGIKYEENILLIGITYEEKQEQLSHNLLEIANEQTNQIRTLIKEKLNKKTEESETELLFSRSLKTS